MGGGAINLFHHAQHECMQPAKNYNVLHPLKRVTMGYCVERLQNAPRGVRANTPDRGRISLNFLYNTLDKNFVLHSRVAMKTGFWPGGRENIILPFPGGFIPD